MNMNPKLKFITLVFENMCESTFRPTDFEEFTISTDGSLLTLKGENLFSGTLAKHLNFVLNSDADMMLVTPIHTDSNTSVFTYLMNSGEITQVIFTYSDLQKETYFIDNDNESTCHLCNDGISDWLVFNV